MPRYSSPSLAVGRNEIGDRKALRGPSLSGPGGSARSRRSGAPITLDARLPLAYETGSR